jgi:hypothetical protein
MRVEISYKERHDGEDSAITAQQHAGYRGDVDTFEPRLISRREDKVFLLANMLNPGSLPIVEASVSVDARKKQGIVTSVGLATSSWKSMMMISIRTWTPLHPRSTCPWPQHVIVGAVHHRHPVPEQWVLHLGRSTMVLVARLSEMVRAIDPSARRPDFLLVG